MEKAVVAVPMREDLVKMLTIGIGDENLTKLLTGHQADNLLHTMCVELVEDIVEQQQRQVTFLFPLSSFLFPL